MNWVAINGIALTTLVLLPWLDAPRVGVDRRALRRLLAAVIVGALLGGRWFALAFEVPPGEWFAPPWRPLTLWGGMRFQGCIVGAIAAGAAVGLPMGLHPTRLAAAFIAVPAAAFAVAKLGCLFAGCCFGAPTELPWAVVHGPDSPAALHQAQLGLVPAGAASLPVHPAAAYAVLGSLAVFYVTWFGLRRFAPTLRAYTYAALGLFAAEHFVLELTRGDPRGAVAGGLLSPSQAASLLMLPGLYVLDRLTGYAAPVPNPGVTPSAPAADRRDG